MVADAAGAQGEGGLTDAVQGDADFTTLIGRTDVAFGGGVPHRLLHQGFRPAQEALPVRKALAAGIEAAVQDLHAAACLRVCGLAGLLDAHVPLPQPANLPFSIAAAG